jgi:hypothetical protein
MTVIQELCGQEYTKVGSMHQSDKYSTRHVFLSKRNQMASGHATEFGLLKSTYTYIT